MVMTGLCDQNLDENTMKNNDDDDDANQKTGVDDVNVPEKESCVRSPDKVPVLDPLVTEPQDLSYRVDLFHDFPLIVSKSKYRSQLGHVITESLMEYATVEERYGKLGLKNMKKSEPLPPISGSQRTTSYSNQWKYIHFLFIQLHDQNCKLASRIRSKILPPMKQFTVHHDRMIKSLEKEGNEVLKTLAQAQAQHEKAKTHYHHSCADAIEILHHTSSQADDDADATREIPKDETKLPATESSNSGPVQLWNKVWENTTSLAKPITEKFVPRMDWPLQHVLVTEQKYRKSVEQLNLVQKRYVTQAQANLHNFELTEEQHGEYLKDHFGRFMNIMVEHVKLIHQIMNDFHAAIHEIDGSADIDLAMHILNHISAATDPSDLVRDLEQYLHSMRVFVDKGHEELDQICVFLEDSDQSMQHYIGQLRRVKDLYDNSTTNFRNVDAYQQSLQHQDSLQLRWSYFVEQLAIIAQNYDGAPRQDIDALRIARERIKATHQDLHDRQYLIIQTLVDGIKDTAGMQKRLEEKGRELQTEMVEYAKFSKLVGTSATTYPSKVKKFESSISGLKSQLHELESQTNEKRHVVHDSQFVLLENTHQLWQKYHENETYRIELIKGYLRTHSRAKLSVIKETIVMMELTSEKMADMNASKDIHSFIQHHKKPFVPFHPEKVIENKNPLLIQALSVHLSSVPLNAALEKETPNVAIEKDTPIEDLFPNVSMDEDQGENVLDMQPEKTEKIIEEQIKKPIKKGHQLVRQYVSSFITVNTSPSTTQPQHTGQLMLFNEWIDFEPTNASGPNVRIRYSQISRIHKKTATWFFSHGIGIEIETLADERYHVGFGSVFLISTRDECFVEMVQLWKIQKELKEVMTNDENVAQRRRFDPTVFQEAQRGYELLLSEPRCFSLSLTEMFNTFWNGQSTYAQYLAQIGETNVDVSEWQVHPHEYIPFEGTGMTSFLASRSIDFVHHKKYFVGPSVVPTHQTQRYDHDKTKLIILVTASISQVLYHDYFRLETLWTFFPDPAHAHRCYLQVGMKVVFSKTTWIKKQIELASFSESRASLNDWIDFAVTDQAQRKESSTQKSGNSSIDVIHPTTTDDTIDDPPRTFNNPIQPFWIITITLLCLLFWILIQYHVKLQMLERALDVHQRALDRICTRLHLSSPEEILYNSKSHEF